jgi:hypothetical protein
MSSVLKKLFSRQRDAARELAQSVESIRSEILRRQDEAARIAGQPAERAEALAALDTGLDRMAERGADALSIGSLALPGFRAPHLSLNVPANWTMDVIALVARDQLRDVLAEKLAEFYDGRDVMSRAKRGPRVETLEAEILDLELAEEALIREAERANVPVMRRDSADPRAVLAADAALPIY